MVKSAGYKGIYKSIFFFFFNCRLIFPEEYKYLLILIRIKKLKNPYQKFWLKITSLTQNRSAEISRKREINIFFFFFFKKKLIFLCFIRLQAKKLMKTKSVEIFNSPVPFHINATDSNFNPFVPTHNYAHKSSLNFPF